MQTRRTDKRLSKKGKKSVKKAKKDKDLTIKFTKVNAKKGGHFCGGLYHTDNYELESIQGGQAQFFNKDGTALKENWKLFKPGKRYQTNHSNMISYKTPSPLATKLKVDTELK